MKNLINVLLYVLLGLLVVTIAVMIYKKFKAPAETQIPIENNESTYADSTSNQALPFTAEDSIILGLTGELPTQVGPESDASIPQTSASKENVSPIATTVANHESTPKIETKTEVKENTHASKTSTKEVKISTPTAKKEAVKTGAPKAKTAQKVESNTVNKSSAASSSKKASGSYYVVSGSFLVPTNADHQVAKLKKLGFFNASKIVFKNSSSYSAVTGQYESEAAARASLNKLKSKGEVGFIKKI